MEETEQCGQEMLQIPDGIEGGTLEIFSCSWQKNILNAMKKGLICYWIRSNFFAGMSVVLFERKRFILNNEVGSNGLSRNPFEVGQKYSIICP